MKYLITREKNRSIDIEAPLVFHFWGFLRTRMWASMDHFEFHRVSTETFGKLEKQVYEEVQWVQE